MLSRHERERVEALERGAEELARRLDRAEARAEIYESQYASLLSAHTDSLRVFEKLAEQYTDGLTRARQTIKELSAVEQAPPTFRNGPLHKSEEEEDLEFQLDHGVIDMSQYNEALRLAGLADD